MQAPIQTSLMDLSTVPCMEYIMTGHNPMHSNPTDSIGRMKNAMTCNLDENFTIYLVLQITKEISIIFQTAENRYG